MLKYLLSSLLFLASLSLLSSQDKVIEDFKRKIETTNSFLIEFSSNLPQQEKPLKGTLVYKKPNSIKIKLGETTIYANENVVRTYNKKLNRLVVSNADEYELPLNFNVILNEIISSSTIDYRLNDSGDYLFIVRGVSINSVKKIELTTDKNFIFKKIKTTLPDGRKLETKVLRMSFNPNNIEELLKTDFPSNARVIDLR